MTLQQAMSTAKLRDTDSAKGLLMQAPIKGLISITNAHMLATEVK